MNKLAVSTLAGALVAAALAVSPASAADSGPGFKLGVITCDTIPGTQVQLLIHSSVSLDCVFETAYGKEHYKGESGVGLGLDLSWNRQKRIAYTVMAATSDYKIGSYGLAGKFVGGQAGATVGVGVGAAALVGGGARNFTLQPIALSTSTGIGVEGGIGYLFLEPNPAADRK